RNFSGRGQPHPMAGREYVVLAMLSERRTFTDPLAGSDMQALHGALGRVLEQIDPDATTCPPTVDVEPGLRSTVA
ncbi:MAG: hypothetical protein ABI360_01765, partial [Allobranchiibius sp.]